MSDPYHILEKYAAGATDSLLKEVLNRYFVEVVDSGKTLSFQLFLMRNKKHGYSLPYSCFLMYKELAAAMGGKLRLSKQSSGSLAKKSSSTSFDCKIFTGSTINVNRYLPMMLMLAKKHLSSDRIIKSDERAVPYSEQLELDVVELNDLPKSVQIKFKSNGNVPKTSVKVKGTDYSNASDKLLNAINSFATKAAVIEIAKKLDAASSSDVKATLRKLRVSTSGYLYSYFPAFFAVCLMKDKVAATSAILEIPGLLKQFNAFTVGWSSLTSGAFLYHKPEGEVKKVAKSWDVISEAMPKLLPLSQDQVDALVGIRGTLSFKNYLKNHYTEV